MKFSSAAATNSGAEERVDPRRGRPERHRRVLPAGALLEEHLHVASDALHADVQREDRFERAGQKDQRARSVATGSVASAPVVTARPAQTPMPATKIHKRAVPALANCRPERLVFLQLTRGHASASNRCGRVRPILRTEAGPAECPIVAQAEISTFRRIGDNSLAL